MHQRRQTAAASRATAAATARPHLSNPLTGAATVAAACGVFRRGLSDSAEDPAGRSWRRPNALTVLLFVSRVVGLLLVGAEPLG